MKKARQIIFGWALFLSGIFLLLSTFLPDLILKKDFLLSQLDLISVILSLIIIFIGFKGIETRW